MGFFPFYPQTLPLSGGTISGPLTVTGLLTTQAGVSNSGGNVASTGLTNITAGAALIAQLGNLDIQAAGSGLKVAEGSNAKQGTAVLVGGTLVVANTSVTAASRILLTSNTPGGTTGFLGVSARTVGTSFTILSSNALDTSTVAWEMFEPG